MLHERLNTTFDSETIPYNQKAIPCLPRHIYRLGTDNLLEKIMKFVPGIVFAVISVTLAVDTVSTPVKTFLPENSVYGSLYSPDGLHRIDLSGGALRIVNLADTPEVREVVFGAPVNRVEYTPDGRALTVWAGDSTLWRVDNNSAAVTRHVIEKAYVNQRLCASSDGTEWVIVDKQESTVMVWNLLQGTSRPCFGGKKVNIDNTVFMFSPDGEHLLALTPEDSTLELRSAKNDSLQLLLKLPDTLMVIRMPTFTPDSRQMVIPMYTRSPTHSYALFISCETGAVMNVFPLYASKKDINIAYESCEAFAISHDGTKLLAGSIYTVAVFDLQTSEELLSFSYHDQFLRYKAWFSPDGRSILYNRTMSRPGSDSLVRFDLTTKSAAVLSVQQAPPEMLASGFTAEGPLVIGRYGYESLLSGEPKKWDSLVYRNWSTGDGMLDQKYLENLGDYTIYPIWAYSLDGKLLFEKILTGGSDTAVREMNVYSLGNDARRVFSRNGGYRQAVVSQETRHLLLFDTSTYTVVDCGTFESTTKHHTLPSGWIVSTVSTTSGLIGAFCATRKSPADSMVYTAGIWDMTTGECINQFIINRSSPYNNSFNRIPAQLLPDGRHLVVRTQGYSDTDSNALFQFDITTGERVLKYPGSQGGCDMMLTPDGKQLIAGVEDKGIYCYDALTGTLQRLFTTPYSYSYFRTSPFSFNPSNPKQFISWRTIWELPEPLAAAAAVDKKIQMPAKITSLSRKGIAFSSLPQNTPLRIQIIRPDGRVIMQRKLQPVACSNRHVALSGISDGMVIVRIDGNGKTLFLQRVVVAGG